MAAVLMHEICHGLGPAFARTSAGKVDIRQSIGPAFSGLEEAKADMVGLFGLNWLIDKVSCLKSVLRSITLPTLPASSAPSALAWRKRMAARR